MGYEHALRIYVHAISGDHCDNNKVHSVTGAGEITETSAGAN